MLLISIVYDAAIMLTCLLFYPIHVIIIFYFPVVVLIQRPFPCSMCNERFPNPRQRQRHIEVKHPNGVEIHCPECDRKVSNRAALAQHKYTYHRDAKELKCGRLEYRQVRIQVGTEMW